MTWEMYCMSMRINLTYTYHWSISVVKHLVAADSECVVNME